jgi:demethylmenaquinone methyltransferase/2-methoxy-6-polyprenyl-1,4-benzoquinol methylase
VSDSTLEAQRKMRAYYQARAREYDDWWLGTGLFADIEPPGWAQEVTELTSLVASLPPARVLDVACGTGFLTQHLAGSVVGLDQSEDMLAIAAPRLLPGRVVCARALPLPFGAGDFERVFTSHFYGHLLPEERGDFLAEAARVAGELVVVDSARREGVAPEQWQQRVLGDGSRHEVYKRYFDAGELAGEIGDARVLHEGRWFVAVARERPCN